MRRSRWASVKPAALLLACCAAAAAAATPKGRSHEANPLALLPALPKVHHSSAIEPINASDPVMLHYARITHSLGLTAYWAGSDDVAEAAKACRASDLLPPPPPPPGVRLAAAAPAIRCSIAVNYSPWGEDGSPFPHTAPPTQQGPLEDAELQLFRTKLGNFTAWLADANAALHLSPPVEISVVLLDSERFGTKADDAAWNDAVTRKNNLFLAAARQLVPHAAVEYYSFGGQIRGPTPTGWGVSGAWFTLEEETDIYAVSLYTVPEFGYVREAYTRTDLPAYLLRPIVFNARLLPCVFH
eukprot:COSAG06_NODE_258_length_18940_cov_15.039648_1_plen_299_part_00